MEAKKRLREHDPVEEPGCGEMRTYTEKRNEVIAYVEWNFFDCYACKKALGSGTAKVREVV